MERKAIEPRRKPPAADIPAARSANPIAQLQRTIGNRATGRVLSREEKKTGSSYIVDYAGLGALPLESFSFPARQQGEQAKEVVLVTKMGSHSPKLMQLANGGEAADANVYGTGYDVTFRGAMVSAYHQGSNGGGDDPVETWTLSFTGQEFTKH